MFGCTIFQSHSSVKQSNLTDVVPAHMQKKKLLLLLLLLLLLIAKNPIETNYALNMRWKTTKQTKVEESYDASSTKLPN